MVPQVCYLTGLKRLVNPAASAPLLGGLRGTFMISKYNGVDLETDARQLGPFPMTLFPPLRLVGGFCGRVVGRSGRRGRAGTRGQRKGQGRFRCGV